MRRSLFSSFYLFLLRGRCLFSFFFSVLVLGQMVNVVSTRQQPGTLFKSRAASANELH